MKEREWLGARKLIRLSKHRHERSARHMATAREELAEKTRIRDQQRELIESFRREITHLDARRSMSEYQGIESLQLSSQRRRALVLDMQKEEFYIGAMHSDVATAEKHLARVRAEWLKQGERVKVLQSTLTESDKRTAARADSRAEADFVPGTPLLDSLS